MMPKKGKDSGMGSCWRRIMGRAGASSCAGLGIMASVLLVWGCAHMPGQLTAGSPMMAGGATAVLASFPGVLAASLEAPSRLATQVQFNPDETLLPLSPGVRNQLEAEKRFSLGVDRMVRDRYASLTNKRVLVATNRLAIDSEGRHMLASLLESTNPMVRRVIFFNDELRYPSRSRQLETLVGAHTELRVFERSANAFSPTASMLEEVDVVLVDLAIRGGTFYPEVAFLSSLLREAGLAGLPVVLLDRPVPVDGLRAEGPIGDESLRGTVANYLPLLPVMGMTPGELASLLNAKYGLGVDLEVVQMLNWPRRSGYAPLVELHRLHGVDPAAELPEWEEYIGPTPQAAEIRVAASLLSADLEPAVDATKGLLLLTKLPGGSEAFCERIGQSGVTGLTCHEAGGSTGAVEVGGIPEAGAVLSSVAVWWALAQGNASVLPPEGEGGGYGTTFVFDRLRAGDDPLAIQRAWSGQKDYQDLLARRDSHVSGYSR